MKLLKRLPAFLYFGFFSVLLLSIPTRAYLDPGTVTYLISTVAALFIAAGAALAIFRRKIKLFFQNLGKKKDSSTSDAVTADDAADINPMDDVIDPMEDNK